MGYRNSTYAGRVRVVKDCGDYGGIIVPRNEVDNIKPESHTCQPQRLFDDTLQV